MIKKIIATIIMLAIVAMGATFAYQAAGGDSHAGEGKLRVASSYYPLYDFTRNIGGGKVSVINMTPPGAEPHDYEPSPQELIAAHESDVFIYNGEQMEPWINSFLADHKGPTVEASHGIELIEAGSDEDHEGHDHGPADPHFWLDPVLAQQIVVNIRDGLSRADPENKDYYHSQAEDYRQKLIELDQSFADGVSSCTIDTAISSHGAFSYLAHRYGFHVESIAGIEPDDEPSPAKMAKITDAVKQNGIKYIFFESLVSPRLAQTIASETGVKTLVFDPIEGLSQADQDKGRDYISVQYDNLKNLKRALDCK